VRESGPSAQALRSVSPWFETNWPIRLGLHFAVPRTAEVFMNKTTSVRLKVAGVALFVASSILVVVAVAQRPSDEEARAPHVDRTQAAAVNHY
jgi:hypothetical protein